MDQEYISRAAARRSDPNAQVPTLNTELLRQVIELIERDPNRHGQSSWAMRVGSDPLPTATLNYPPHYPPVTVDVGQVCDTVFCFAGHAVHLTYPDARPVFLSGCRGSAAVQLRPDVPAVSTYEQVAVQCLGLTFEESELLFSAVNTRAFLRQTVDALIQAETTRTGAGDA